MQTDLTCSLCGRICSKSSVRLTPPTPTHTAGRNWLRVALAGKREAHHTALCAHWTKSWPLRLPTASVTAQATWFISGDNLDALEAPAPKFSAGSSFIYIDPPYNTKSDEFIYRDDFTARQTDTSWPNWVTAPRTWRSRTFTVPAPIAVGSRSCTRVWLLAKDRWSDKTVILSALTINEQAQTEAADEVFGQDNFVITGAGVTERRRIFQTSTKTCFAGTAIKRQGKRLCGAKKATSDVKNVY